MEKDTTQNVAPKHQLTITDAIAIIVGIVIGAGIFRTPSLVAANTDSDSLFLFAWVLGGAVSLIGALCYAELTTAFPNTGGDYHFIGRAYGKKLAFLFAWARMSIIQTGSIALLAFIVGDYLTQIHDLGMYSSVWYAAAVVVLLTGINVLCITLGTDTQSLFTFAEMGGVVLVIFIVFFMMSDPAVAEQVTLVSGGNNAMGLALVFVLLTYGGWNEAAYISAEMK